MLDGLFVTPAVVAVSEALAAAARGRSPAAGSGEREAIAVVGNAKLAAALAATHDVLPVGMSARAVKKLPRNVPDTSGLDPASLSAVIGVDIATDGAWAETLRAWSRVVRDGGVIAFLDRGHAEEASRRALCAGLCELEQRHAGRTIITSGLVTHL